MNTAPDLTEELDPHVTHITIPSDLHGSLRKGNDDNDTNCWASPSGKGFMIRGKNYLKDSSKVSWLFKSFDSRVKGQQIFSLIWTMSNAAVVCICFNVLQVSPYSSPCNGGILGVLGIMEETRGCEMFECLTHSADLDLYRLRL